MIGEVERLHRQLDAHNDLFLEYDALVTRILWKWVATTVWALLATGVAIYAVLT